MKTMTIRKIPDDVSARIADMARMGQVSINTQVVMLLRDAVFPGGLGKNGRKRDLSSLRGGWTPSEYQDFNHAIEEGCEQVFDFDNQRGTDPRN